MGCDDRSIYGVASFDRSCPKGRYRYTLAVKEPCDHQPVTAQEVCAAIQRPSPVRRLLVMFARRAVAPAARPLVHSARRI